jgi:hypothetical protein
MSARWPSRYPVWTLGALGVAALLFWEIDFATLNWPTFPHRSGTLTAEPTGRPMDRRSKLELFEEIRWEHSTHGTGTI